MSNIFNQETPEQTNGAQAPSPNNIVNPLDNLLAEIKNERGEQKYRTVEDAVKGVAHAQSYILELKQKQAKLEADYAEAQAKVKAQEELERLVSDAATRQAKQDTPSQAFDESKLAEIVGKQFGTYKLQEQTQANQKSVSDELIKVFGDKAGDVLNSKAQDLGISVDDIASLAGRSPKAVLTMFGVSGSGVYKQPSPAPSSGSINTTNFDQPRNSLLGNKEAFSLKPGATNKDVADLAERAGDLVKQLQERDGVTIHDLTNPSTFFKYFG